jgi:DNA polymerase-3 subunit gamma/tau
VQTLGDVPESFAVTSEHTDRLSAQASRLNQAEILRAIDLLAAAIAAVKDGSEPRIQLEMALLKASQPSSDLSLQALMFRIEQLERRIQGGAAAPADAPPAAPEPQAQAARAQTAPAKPQPATPRASTQPAASAAVAPVVEAVAEPVGASDIQLEQVQRLWPAALEILGEDGMLGAALAETHPIALENGRLVIGFPPDSDFIRKKAEAKRDVIQRALHGLTGATLVIALETSEKAAPPAQRTLTTDELIETVKRDFGAVEVEGESGDN